MKHRTKRRPIKPKSKKRRTKRRTKRMTKRMTKRRPIKSKSKKKKGKKIKGGYTDEKGDEYNCCDKLIKPHILNFKIPQGKNGGDIVEVHHHTLDTISGTKKYTETELKYKIQLPYNIGDRRIENYGGKFAGGNLKNLRVADGVKLTEHKSPHRGADFQGVAGLAQAVEVGQGLAYGLGALF